MNSKLYVDIKNRLHLENPIPVCTLHRPLCANGNIFYFYQIYSLQLETLGALKIVCTPLVPVFLWYLVYFLIPLQSKVLQVYNNHYYILDDRNNSSKFSKLYRRNYGNFIFIFFMFLIKRFLRKIQLLIKPFFICHLQCFCFVLKIFLTFLLENLLVI